LLFRRGTLQSFLAYLAGFFPHLAQRRIRRKLGNRLRKVLVQRIAALLLDLAVFIAMAAVLSRFFHVLAPCCP
jgi:hypothetical protein